jgi:hypothetical protein
MVNPYERMNEAAAILDRVARNLRGQLAHSHTQAGSLPVLRQAVLTALVEVDKVKDITLRPVEGE